LPSAVADDAAAFLVSESTKEPLMRTDPAPATASTRSHTPRALTVFTAAFVAGAAAAVAVNSVLDVRLAQSKPQVASEPIFVALRSLPQGAPVTVWDVALRDWPRAMVPTSALRASDTFSGLVLKHPLREGQPLLSIQLVEADSTPSSRLSVTAVSTPPTAADRTADVDLWAPAEPVGTAAPTAMPPQPPQQAQPQQAQAAPQIEPPTQPVAAPAALLPEPEQVSVTAAPAEKAMPVASEPMPAAPQVAVQQPLADASGAATAADATAETLEPMAADAVAAVEDAITDEMLEALTVTSVPADSLVATPPAGVLDPPAAAEESQAALAEGTQQAAPQPTLADPPLTPVQPQADASAPPASVMRQPESAPAATPVPAPTRIATRYLVVPENIALQADASFTAARPEAEPQPAPQQPPRGVNTAVKPLPPTSVPATAARPGSQTAQPRTGRTQRGGAGAAPPSGRPAAGGATARPQPQPLFPNIAAGIETIEGEMGRLRRDRSGQAQQPTAARPRPQ